MPFGRERGVIKLIPLTAYRMGYPVTINGETGRLVRPNHRVCVLSGKLATGGPNATITEIKTTLTNSTVELYYLGDGETEVETLKLK